ncbi:hypothetical protein EWS92_08075 [Vibrio vulnificus]|nr:hypothetical protein [Vibrio vulnificus]EGR0796988.1 hypothetical protein [Vibrio vulnificus]EGR0876842.1 hypothetical protein [Vibrio vulnificus]
MADLVPESEQQYGSILTVLGESAEQNGKMLKKPVEFTHIAFGDANDTYVQPDRKAQALVNELHRIPVNSVDVLQPTPDSVPILKVEAILPDDINDVVIREFAAVATFNGQSYFHAVGNCARVYVPNPVNNGQLNNPVSLEMTFVITSAEPIVEMDPNVITASRNYVNTQVSKSDERVAQAIIDQNGKDWFIEDGFLVTPQVSAFNIKAGAGYVSGNRVTLEFDRNVQVPNKPSFIYVDAHRKGTPTGEQVTLFDLVVTAEEKDDYTDANGVKHFVCKIAQVLADGSVSDLRPKRKDRINGFNFRGWPGDLLSAIQYSAASGAILEIDDEISGINYTAVVGLSGFNILFHQNAKLKLAANQNKPLIKMHGCSKFSLLGDVLLDGNKKENEGLSSGTFADFFLLGLQECEEFSLGNVTALDAHTGGIGFYACTDFNAGRLFSKGSRQIGVSVDGDLLGGKPTRNWSCVEMRGDGSEFNHGLRMSNVDNFSLLSAIGFNNASNGALFERTCMNGTVTLVKTNENGVNGGKAEETHNMTFGTIDADNNAVHGWAFINNNDSTTAVINSKGNGASGLYLYSSDSNKSTKRNTIGVAKLSENDKGLFVEQLGGGAVLSVIIGTVDISLNNYGVYSEDIILDSEVKIGTGVIKNNTLFDVYAKDKTQRPLLGDDVVVGKINYSTTLTLDVNNTSPILKNSSKTFKTANTTNTNINNIKDNDIKDKMISIRIEDEFTSFTNGSGQGRVIVKGGTINPSVGSIVLAIKSTSEDGSSYYWNVRELS